jgi:tyrosine phenol-lyase
MKAKTNEMFFSLPYEIAMVRSLRRTTFGEREAALKAAYYNTELIPQEVVYVDLKTDSGVSSLSAAQLAKLLGDQPLESAMELAAEANSAFQSLAARFEKNFGFPFLIPVSQGRAAERIWIGMHVKPGAVVPGNMLFPSTRYHIESNGGKVIDVISDRAHDLYTDEPFKGNVDLAKLQGVFQEHEREEIPCVYVELCVNACGGQPVSLGNLRAAKEMAAANGVALFLDACRILENSWLVKQREPEYKSASLGEIVRETCSLADGCTMSALKDFLTPMGGFIATRDEAKYQKASLQNFLGGSQPSSMIMGMIANALEEIFAHEAYVKNRVEQIQYLWQKLSGTVPVLAPAGGHAVFLDMRNFLPQVRAEEYPGAALAAFIYQISGIRVTPGPPPAPSQSAHGVELLRFAVPARRYLKEHMDDVADAVLYAFAHRQEIKGLRRIEKPGRSRYGPALFAPL